MTPKPAAPGLARFVFPEIFRFYAERTARGEPPAGVLQSPAALWLKFAGFALGALLPWLLARLLPRPDFFRKPAARTRGTLYFYNTLNQRDALKPAAAHDPTALTVSDRLALDADAIVNRSAARRWAFRHLPRVLGEFVRGDADLRRFIADFGLRYLRSLGYRDLFNHLLAMAGPACVVLSNDHLTEHRTLLWCCRQARIPTVYIQHAAVTDRFPPLSFTWALLDGEDSLEKYRRAGPLEAKVSLVGIGKFSDLSAVHPHEPIKSIGVCTKTFSEVARVRAVCEGLKQWFPTLTLRLRPHPGTARPDLERLQALCAEAGIEMSNAREESSAQFLRRVDLVIGGNSSVLLDAAMLNVVPVYFGGMEPPETHPHDGRRSYCMGCYYGFGRDDYYGLRASGLCLRADTLEDLRTAIAGAVAERPRIRERAKQYSETIGTRFDGHSDELIARCLEDIRAGRTPGLRPASEPDA
ncbi:MAG: hypothetical protein ACT4PK_01470 [Gammaproteobacteria bacterium]